MPIASAWAGQIADEDKGHSHGEKVTQEILRLKKGQWHALLISTTDKCRNVASPAVDFIVPSLRAIGLLSRNRLTQLAPWSQLHRELVLA